jgi:hypothetical protein
MGEWRKVTNTVHETGMADRDEDTYEFGAEIDGVFVAAVTKSAGYIEHVRARNEQAQKDAQENGTSGDEGTSGTSGS